jgi:hypothetical protein
MIRRALRRLVAAICAKARREYEPLNDGTEDPYGSYR